ncbi:DUF934 domain-containing protein [Paludibacterium yongneupense]|uniref:DUF934 domain-containing protein n=1 Tax=Paludibacterium yongneupense TaxID=400061 RepID=UPI00042668B1|nr:DUF934 domain-containing protein [Paludibacterium yongneupense]
MPRIIKDGQLVDDRWIVLRRGELGELPPCADDDDVIVPLDAWLADPAFWSDRPGRCGVWLAPDADLGPAGALVAGLPLLAVDFPVFTDGRGYSIGRLLRERYNFDGELRAIGDVGRDQLQLLWQVGFNAFVIKAGQDVAQSLAGLDCFSEHYQGNYRDPQPLFKRSRPAT